MQETFNILFVDDEENVLKALRRLFIDEGLEVFTAASGKEGLEIVKNAEFAVIVSDQRMPEMTGVEFLQHTKELCPDTVRIMLTGYADVHATIKAINEAGAQRYITKPWNDEEIKLIIKQAIDRFRLIKENKRLFALSEKQKEEAASWNKELEYYVQMHTIDLTNKDKEIKAFKAKLETYLKGTINALNCLIQLRDKTIFNHSKNVALISVAVAKRLNLDASEIERIDLAGSLHDIGKIVMPDIILVKKIEELSPDEMNQYIRHPLTGQMITGFVEDLQKVGELIKHHHEHFNGTGFPDKLREEKIPLGSRIIAITDRFERLAAGMSVEDSLKKIRSRLGKEFDPELYEHLEIAAYEVGASLFSSNDIVEAELAINNLTPGLLLSRDVVGASGLVLIKKDTVLTQKNIEQLDKALHMDQAKNSIFVYKKRK
jgi:response regulator RpfG family c-di-GMP phosphodiesterase